MNDLGKKLRNIREKLGMSQQDVAEKSGIGYKTINNYEKGVSRPDVEKLAILCEVFHVSADYFISHKSANKKFNYYLNADEISVIEKYKILSPASKDAVIDSLVSLKKIEDQFKQQQTAQKIEAELQALKEESDAQPELYARRIRRGGVANNAPPIPKKEHKMTKLNHFEGAYGAGGGQINDNATMITIEVSEDEVPEGADTTINIAGDSMEPTLSDGDVVYVQHTNQLEIGEIGVFYLDGRNFIKEYGGDELISHNSEYAPIQIHEFSTFVIQGKVLGKKIEGFVEL